MLDNSRKWQVEPYWATAHLQGRNIAVRGVEGLQQRLVSGDLDGFRTRFGFRDDAGALGLAVGECYTVRLARDRLLAVGIPQSDLSDGWQDAGYAVTTVSSALRVFEARGKGVADLLARATTIDPANPGPSAAMPFCGVTCSVYFHADIQTLRLHIDRGLAAYLWNWFECQPLFRVDMDEE